MHRLLGSCPSLPVYLCRTRAYCWLHVWWVSDWSGRRRRRRRKGREDNQSVVLCISSAHAMAVGVIYGVLLKWKADFGSTLDSCVILGVSSVLSPGTAAAAAATKSSASLDEAACGGGDDNGSIPESFYTNGGLKLRVVWTISSLIAASARHYLLQQIIAEHATLESLVLTDLDGQGVLRMDREQLEELRVKPLSASASANRTLVPALNMRLWYAPHLELPDGTVLKGATLVAIRPSEQTAGKKEPADGGCWVSAAFEEPYGIAARVLVKRRTYCLEMNSF